MACNNVLPENNDLNQQWGKNFLESKPGQIQFILEKIENKQVYTLNDVWELGSVLK